jgi:hypothetical protein
MGGAASGGGANKEPACSPQPGNRSGGRVRNYVYSGNPKQARGRW